MNTRLYIGNLSQTTREADLENLFNEVGLVMSVSIPADAKTGAHKNFGFVTMGSTAAAESAIKSLDGKQLCERQISVREAGPKE
jgi:RNA recognition motif-containing protein